MRAALSKRQRQVYEYLRAHPEATVAEIGSAFNIGHVAAHEHLTMVALKGWAEHRKYQQPAYRALPPYECCPHCGKELQP